MSCERNDTHDYLAVTPVEGAEPAIVDMVLNEVLGSTWGLHLLDPGIVADDLVELVRRQGEAFAGR